MTHHSLVRRALASLAGTSLTLVTIGLAAGVPQTPSVARAQLIAAPFGHSTIGAASNAQTDASWQALTSSVGPLKWRRTYNSLDDFPANHHVPTSWNASAAGHDAALGVTVSHLSFKSDPTNTAAGTYDSLITAFARTIPASARITWYHEPEGPTDMPGATDLAQATVFRNAFTHVYNAIKAGNPAVQVGPIVTCGLWWPGQGHLTNINVWLGAPADFFGVDCYNGWNPAHRLQTDPDFRPWSTADQIYSTSLDWLGTNRPGKPRYITEWGSAADPNDLTKRAAWITDTVNYFDQHGVSVALYWSKNDYLLDDSPSLAAFAAANANSKRRVMDAPTATFTGFWASGTTASMTIPTTVQVSDLLIATGIYRQPNSTITAPAGWTLLNAGADANITAAVWYKKATASDPGSTQVFALGGPGSQTMLVGAAYADTDQASPIDGHTFALGGPTATTTVTCRAVAGTSGERDVLLGVALGSANGAQPVLTPATGYAKEVSRIGPSATLRNGNATLADKTTTAAPTGGTSFTSSASVYSGCGRVTLRPASAP